MQCVRKKLSFLQKVLLLSLLFGCHEPSQANRNLLTGAINWIYNSAKIVTNKVTSVLAGPILADTHSGRVKGTKEASRLGKTFYWFRGIPYAQPPVGDLRFEPPVPRSRWEGVLDATHFKQQCWQMDLVTQGLIGDEDCLTLSVASKKVYTKNNLPTTNAGLHPVIVFIHGGLFMQGSQDIYRPKYFLDEDVVLVTLNYRLASFGFLNTGDGLVQGNMGLRDQTLALQWVQKNIKFFNGDPNRVTILGESAGSVCVHLHTLSPMSRGLFHRAISQSGTALSPWGLIENPEVQAKELAEELGCQTYDRQRMLMCLKSLPGRRIARTHLGFIKALAQDKHTLYGPTVEVYHDGPYFLPSHPLDLMKAGNISNTPWINGVNSAEGLVHLIPILRNETMKKLINKEWDRFAPVLLEFQNHDRKSALAAEVKQHYLNNQPLSLENAKEAAKMVSDRDFFLDSHDAVILQSKVAPTYAYYYTYKGLLALGNLLFSKTILPLPGNLNYLAGTAWNWWSANFLRQQKDSKLGICHADEMPLLFNIPVIRTEINQFDVDYDFSRKLIRLWVSFAEDGIPDPRAAWQNVQWNTIRDTNPSYQDVQLQRLHLDKKFGIILEPFYEGLQFWKRNSISYLMTLRCSAYDSQISFS